MTPRTGGSETDRADTPLTRKLAAYAPLTQADRADVVGLLGPIRRLAARAGIVQEGDDPRTVNVVLEGWAGRVRQLSDGRRQIVALLLPGDTCDPHVAFLDRRDHTIEALTPVTLTQISGRGVRRLSERSPALDQAFHRDGLAIAAIQREWTTSLGCRTGLERLAHLFCEVHARLWVVGLTDGAACPFPLTQTDLGEALGQTPVHVNRTLQDLRRQHLVALRDRRLTLLDPVRLATLAQFDPTYLHLGPGVEDRWWVQARSGA